MHNQSQIAGNKEEQVVLHQADVASSASDRWVDVPCKLDGSMEAMGRCLETLMELTCQDASEHHVPLLELRFGEIVTMTSLLIINERGYLSIIAFLPRATGDALLSTAHLAMSAMINGSENILWHADKGCYVISRKFPVAAFSEEREVLDAIADTSDEAAAWQASRIDQESIA